MSSFYFNTSNTNNNSSASSNATASHTQPQQQDSLSGFSLPNLPNLAQRNTSDSTQSGTFFTSNNGPSSSHHPGYNSLLRTTSGTMTDTRLAALEEFATPPNSSLTSRPRKRVKKDFGDSIVSGPDLEFHTEFDELRGFSSGEESRTNLSQSKPRKFAGNSVKSSKNPKGKGKNTRHDSVLEDTADEMGDAGHESLVGFHLPQISISGTSNSQTNPSKPKTQRKNQAEKKKKAGRACAVCQKAHLTCDDERPCARCIKKGCPEKCHDGQRKKAKYLQEVPDELLERRPHFGYQQSHADSNSNLLEEDELLNSPAAQPETSQPFNFDSLNFFDQTSFQNEFGSEAANLEYAIISNMLNGNGFSLDTTQNSPTQFTAAHDPRMNGTANGASMLTNSAQTNPNPQFSLDPFKQVHAETTSPNTLNNNSFTSPNLTNTNSLYPAPNSARSLTGENLFTQNSSHDPQQAGGRAGPSPAPTSGTMTGEEAYRAVTKPYSYAQSYHYLVKHLKQRFEKNDILRIIRALASFRPSLIALQMPLSEEDETFVERTFQRTLVELNKLISFSGTPTLVWRRTGEICLVGTEFCLLTGWSRDELVGKKYIFELLDCASVVEYYEDFAKHAFESTSSSVEMQCVVLGPSGRPVPCAMCFTIRRDLFSCPFLIVGSLLPILV